MSKRRILREATAEDMRRAGWGVRVAEDGYAFVVAVQGVRWSAGGDGERCRCWVESAAAVCGAPAVATLNRGGQKPQRWGYCAEHMYGRWIEGGEVVWLAMVPKAELGGIKAPRDVAERKKGETTSSAKEDDAAAATYTRSADPEYQRYMQARGDLVHLAGRLAARGCLRAAHAIRDGLEVMPFELPGLPRRRETGPEVSTEEHYCHAERDGECDWERCPQIRDGEPYKSGRHCPLDHRVLEW